MAMAAGVPVRRDGRRAPPGERPGLAVGSERRLLEADSKSLCSVNGARRASASSPGPSSLALSQLGPLEEETWSLWGRIVSNWDEWRKKKEKLLKGFACVSTERGPKWVSARHVKPYRVQTQVDVDPRSREASTQTKAEDDDADVTSDND
ncbi:uncharacterized protein [Taeniopygia guttata]|uniref:uncharacterized protein isoform X14 n=1 Tax=Taeniopygia guttata TaxID=59729 RepID=UPI003BB895DB